MTGEARPVRFALRSRGRELPLPLGLVRVGQDRRGAPQVDTGEAQGPHLRLRVAETEVRVETIGGQVRVDGGEVPPGTKLHHGALLELDGARLHFVDYHHGLDGETTSRRMPGAAVGSTLEALADLDDAITSGRWTEARDRLSTLAIELPAGVSAGTLLDAMTRAAAALGAGTLAPRWIDWALELCTRHDHVPSSSAVDAIAEAAPRCRWRGGPSLAALVRKTQGRDPRELLRIRRLLAVARRAKR